MNAEERRRFLIVVGTLFLAYMITLLPFPPVFSNDAVIMIAITLVGAVFWITECIPISMTALVIIVLQALFGIKHIGDGLAHIATPVNSIIEIQPGSPHRT